MRYLRIKNGVGLMVMIVLLASVALLRADPGDLDLTFGGGDGYVTTDLGFHDWAFDIVIDSANRLVVAGNVSVYDSGISYTYGVIVRYNPDGTLDTTFGDDGKVSLDFSPLSSYLTDVALDTSGRIIVAGLGDMDSFLARFNPDGSPDLSFGDQGFVFEAPSSAVHITADNKIIAAGGGIVARYNADGSLDTPFGYNGYVWSFSTIVDLLVSADGNDLILLIEYEFEDIMLLKIDLETLYESEQGYEWSVITDIDENNYPRDAAWDADGNIVITGFVNPDSGGPRKLIVARYLPDGSLDTSFADNGIAILQLAHGIEGHSSVIDEAGRIIVAGTSYYELTDNSISAQAFVARYLPNGELDSTFGGDGLVFFTEAMAEDVILDAAGNIVIVGLYGVFNPPARDFFVARYQGGDLPATATPTPTETATATETLEPTATMTATNTLTPTETATLEATAEATTTTTPDDGIELVVNGGFENELTGWQVKKLTKDKVKCDKPGKTIAYEGDCAFRFKGSVGEKSQILQKPDLAGMTFAAGDVFTLQAYVKAKGQVNFQAQAKFTYADETKAKIVLKVSAATDGYVAFADDYALTDANLLKVKVALKNKSTKGKVDVDAVSLNYGTAAAESGLLALP